MVRIIIESDNKVAVTVRKQDNGTVRLLRDLKEGVINDDDKAWCVPLSEKNILTLTMLGATLDDEL